MTVWIAQCLCPQRHCILASAGEASSRRQAEEAVMRPLRERVAKLVREKGLNPWCGICRAKEAEWHIEVGRSRWSTLDAAMPALREIEARQVATAAIIGDLGKPN